MQEDNPTSIEHDKISDIWYVYLEDDKVKCNCENDAIFFDSNIIDLVEKMRSYDSFKADENRRKNFIERLENAVAIIKNYPHSIAFSALIDFEKTIPQSDRYW